MRSEPISPALFARNRKKLLADLDPEDLIIASASPRVIRSGDLFYPYRQHSDFFYLSGIPQPESVLVLDSGCEILYISEVDNKTLVWNGPMLSREEASELSGIEDVRWLKELDGNLNKLPWDHRQVLYNDPALGLVKEHFPLLPASSLSEQLKGLRMIKEPEEIEQIKKACNITRSAFFRMLGHLEPGIEEYRLEAELTAGMLLEGAAGHAFEPILASGSNALVLHYVDNRSRCAEGDLILMDFGAEWNCYAADCSRTLPVNGKFSSRQNELYSAVLRMFFLARSMMVPGIQMDDFHRRVGEAWEEEHMRLGLYSRASARAAPEPLWKKYFMHGTSHSLGLDVHDPFDRSIPFTPGMVLSCEPGLYIPEEGVGIRLESDILITDEGPVDLMEDIPLDSGELEELIRRS